MATFRRFQTIHPAPTSNTKTAVVGSGTLPILKYCPGSEPLMSPCQPTKTEPPEGEYVNVAPGSQPGAYAKDMVIVEKETGTEMGSVIN